MNELFEREARETAAADVPSRQLGQWMGRREAFGLMAGRCSAADVEILRRLKDENLYAAMDCTWDDFCTGHLHVARRTVDHEIRLLREFGPAFFTVRQLTHISVKDYQAIAAHITDQGVHVDGEVIALLPENSEPLAAAVEELVKRSGSEDREAAPAPFDALLKRCQAVGRALRAFEEKLDSQQQSALV